MEKLIALLNEYEAKLEEMPLTRKRWGEENWILWRRFMTKEDAERMVISKSFGFIKWLAVNYKIDLEELETELSWMWMRCNIWYYEGLLMVLSIKDSPIDFLISILE